MSKKEKMLIKKACKALGITFSDGNFDSVKEIEAFREEIKQHVENTIVGIETLNEALEKFENNLGTLEALLHQIDVEKYKELNPHVEDIF